VQNLLREGKLSVIFDLSGLSFIDSAGVGNVVMCFDKLKKSGGTLLVAGAQGYVENTLKMTHVNDVMPLLPSVEAAAASFVNRPSSRPDSPPGPAPEPPARYRCPLTRPAPAEENPGAVHPPRFLGSNGPIRSDQKSDSPKGERAGVRARAKNYVT
jgi:anti-anti-sigma regulatory factor